MNRKFLTITRPKSDDVVSCIDCVRLNPQATRHRAAQHVKQTGHTVRIVVSNVTVYKPIQEPTS